MRVVNLVLGFVLLALQIRLWLGDGGFWERRQLKLQIAELESQINAARERNQALEAEVEDLKHNLMAVEERARRDLGMIRDDEIFVLVMENP
ncbi:MAG: septum formation initiator family protein [Methylohalobius sp.]|nr:septum formation initiator family protein [Methylohalobius sp.]